MNDDFLRKIETLENLLNMTIDALEFYRNQDNWKGGFELETGEDGVKSLKHKASSIMKDHGKRSYVLLKHIDRLSEGLGNR